MSIFHASRKKNIKKKPPPPPLKRPDLEPPIPAEDIEKRATPRLERNNAVKFADHEKGKGSGRSRSLDVGEVDKAWLRIDGEREGQVELLYRTIGISGPDDFGIPHAAWEAEKAQKAQKARSSSDALPRATKIDFSWLDSPPPLSSSSSVVSDLGKVLERDWEGGEERLSAILETFDDCCGVRNGEEVGTVGTSRLPVDLDASLGRGLRGTRPPILSTSTSTTTSSSAAAAAMYLPPPPPPPQPRRILHHPIADDTIALTGWDFAFALGPQDQGAVRCPEKQGRRGSVLHDKRVQGEDCVVPGTAEEQKDMMFPSPVGGEFTGSGSFTTTSNDDDCSSTTTEGIFVLSPYNRCRSNVGQWTKGRELGRGSFGVVFEAFTEVGNFFAVKEVSLIDQGSDAIEQLEREICFLSSFEHENIVRYLGTHKEESNLYIFLELVTQGSLATLYKNYDLRDSQVSSYTRQILYGLKYLHERNVVHRDIKCANLPVATDGSVKLADFGLASGHPSTAQALPGIATMAHGLDRRAPSTTFPYHGKTLKRKVIKPQSRHGYGTAADIWSLGCSVLEMFSKQPPYFNLEWVQAFYQIGNGLKPDIPDSLSSDAADFIHQCIQFNPNDRPTAEKLLQHPFVRRKLPSSPLVCVSDSPERGSAFINKKNKEYLYIGEDQTPTSETARLFLKCWEQSLYCTQMPVPYALWQELSMDFVLGLPQTLRKCNSILTRLYGCENHNNSIRFDHDSHDRQVRSLELSFVL